MKSLLFAAALLICGAVNAEAQYSGSCTYNCGMSYVGVGDWEMANSSAEAHCNLALCFFQPNQYQIEASSWVMVMGCNVGITFVAVREESWENGYVTSWITLHPFGYPYWALASFGIAKDYTGATVTETAWIHPNWITCIVGGVS